MLQIHYIRTSLARSVLFFAIGLVLVALVACTDEPSDGKSSSSSGVNSPVIVDGEWPFDSSNESLQATSGLQGLNLENVIEIKYKNGSAPEIKNTFAEVTITPTGENIVVMIPTTSNVEYNFVLSGTTTNGSLKFYGDVRKGLYLNGVSITNSKGPAINIQKSGRVTVHLVNGTQNFLEDALGYVCSSAPEGTEQAKGAFFSEGKLIFEGSGSLEVKGKCNHAIVADNDIEIKNGKITVSESVNDGIHANDIIQVSGGVVKVQSVGDAIQSEREAGKVIITGGKIKTATADVKSHGIASEGPISIKGNAIIQINTSGNGSKGIRSRGFVEFQGSAKTLIKTSGTKHTDPTDPEDESNSAGVKLAAELFLEGGELTIKSTGNGAKGINTIAASLTAGKIDIDADDDGLRVHGNLNITGTSGTIKSKKKKAINADTWNGNKGSITTQDGAF